MGKRSADTLRSGTPRVQTRVVGRQPRESRANEVPTLLSLLSVHVQLGKKIVGFCGAGSLESSTMHAASGIKNLPDCVGNH